ncbi:HVO_2922 family protein [Halomarina rubra]|uniref:HVO_2922 family protein n=1 Tax=Halomarina rubra TaxID=2071873 RepID=A0ABD6AVQ3_9EURY
MNGEPRVAAALTVTVDDARLSLTASEGEEAVTDLEGPGVRGELRVRVGRDPNGRSASAGEEATDATTAANAGRAEDRATDDRSPADRVTDDPTPTSARPVRAKAHFEVYEDRAGEFRWRLVHDNGNVIADSGEGYATWGGAENGLRSVKQNAPGAPIERL